MQVVDGGNLLSDRKATEEKKLKKVKLSVVAMLASVGMWLQDTTAHIQPKRQNLTVVGCMQAVLDTFCQRCRSQSHIG